MQIDFETNLHVCASKEQQIHSLYMSKCQSEGLQAAGLVTRNILAGNRIRTTAPPQEYAASTVNQPASQDGFEPTFFFVTWHILASGTIGFCLRC